MTPRSSAHLTFMLVLAAALGGCAKEIDDSSDAEVTGDAGVVPDAGGQECDEGETRTCARAEGCQGSQMCEGGAYGACVAPLERCNGADDDCDGAVDEDFAGLGEACSAGVGACAAHGVQVCDAAGEGLVCDATAGSPSAEVCDGADNDCDGTIDELGAPTFLEESHGSARSCFDLALGHIDDDGHLDIVCAMMIDTPVGPDTRLAYYSSTGPGTFDDVQYTAPVAVSPFRAQSDVALGDLDGDGRDDIVAVGETMKVQVYLNTGGAFAAPVEAFDFDAGGEHGTGGLALHDFDGDGHLDIFTVVGTLRDAATWRLVVSVGNGDGTFAPPTELAATDSGVAKDIVVGDVDDDGDQDALVLTHERVLVYRREGGTFAAPEVLISGLEAVEELGYGDATGDGRSDLLIPQPESIQFHPAEGAGFGAPVTATLPGAAFAAAFAQFDCDPTAEAAVAIANGGARPRLYADPATLTSPIDLPSPDTGFLTMVFDDLDGDGRDDLVLARSDSGVSVLRRQP